MHFETRFRFPVSHDVRGDLDTGYFWASNSDDAFNDAVRFCAYPYKGHQKPLASTSIDVGSWDLAQVGPVAYLTRDEYLSVCPKQLENYIEKRIINAKSSLSRFRAKSCPWAKIAFEWDNAAKRALKRKLSDCVRPS